MLSLITTNYFPEPTGIALYTTDLAELISRENLNCQVLTSLPHYPWWRVPDNYLGIQEGIHLINQVSVVRARHIIPKKFNVFNRLRFEFSLYWNMNRMSKKMRTPTTIVACIPTVASLYVALKIKRRSSAPLGVIVQDLSGRGASQSGVRGGLLVAKVAEWIELRALRQVDAIVVVSESMSVYLEHAGIPNSKITLIQNYSLNTPVQITKSEAREKIGWLESDFLAIHTGNMGLKQNLNNLIEAAKNLPSGIKIKIIGHGNQEKSLKELAKNIPGIEILPAVSDEMYPFVLAAADVLIINERSTQLDMSLPSKLTSYLLSDRPVLAAVPPEGATAKFLKSIAEVVIAGDPNEVVRALVNLHGNEERRNELAKLGYSFAKANLNSDIGRLKYLEWIKDLTYSKAIIDQNSA